MSTTAERIDDLRLRHREAVTDKEAKAKQRQGAKGKKTARERIEPVSYTHLTLPTSDLV